MYIEDDERDDLEDFIAECAKSDPELPALVEAALQRRLAMRARGEDPNEEETPTQVDTTDGSHPAPPEVAAVHD